MSSYNCTVCGYFVDADDDDELWLRQFRASFSVTGVGCRDDNEEWVAPSDPARRWDDDEDDAELLELPVMRQRPRDDCHGFALHDACWMLLRHAWGSGEEEIRVDRLVEMCKSLPLPIHHSGLGWQHGYGGLLNLETVRHFPWQEAFMPPRDLEQQVWRDAPANPYDVPGLPALLLSCTKPQPVRGLNEKSASDYCFSRLPWELREAIATLLPTTDALALRQASVSFLPLLSSAAFWASRFAPDGERGFVFELHGRRREPTDWLELYRLTSQKRTSLPGLRNRCRIWRLLKPIVELARLELQEDVSLELQENLTPSVEGITTPPTSADIKGDMKFTWLPTGAGGWLPFEEGCSLLRTSVVSVPDRLLKIGLSTICFGTTTYITGLRFVSETVSACVGYITDREEFIVVQELHGFRVAAAPSGIRALQVVDKDGYSSAWVGDPEGVPVSERTTRPRPVKVLNVHLDGFKITGLGVVTPSPDPREVAVDADKTSLRQSALWYPDIPPAGLYFNETSFTGECPRKDFYRPLLWTLFGGERGDALKHLVGLSVEGVFGLTSLEFKYDGKYHEHYPTKLGTGRPTDSSSTPTFLIDGAAGEFITSISAHVEQTEDPRAYAFARHGILSCFTIKTNRGREFRSNPDCDHSPSDLQLLKIAEETTITGLYTSHHPENGLISLGVISEMLESPVKE